MRKSIAIAATLMVAASATAAGAYSVPAKYFGSDTLQIVTFDSITNTPGLGASLAADYLAGGSGAGQGAMGAASVAVAPQQTAPMSKMMTNGVCNVLGGNNGDGATNASGIVVGMDAVDILSSTATGGTTACNGDAGPGGDLTGFGTAYSGSTVFANGNTGQNWKWVLALLYGGLDLSNPTANPDCNSTARQSLINNWSSLFQTGCTNTASICNNAAHQVGGKAVLWHAFRRDDASGTSDVFSALLGLQIWLNGGPSTSSLNGFGASPYCNAMNWDTNTASNGTTCNLGTHDQFVGPGGVQDPASTCVFTSFTHLTTAEVCTGGAGSGNHRMPPPGTYGANPPASVVGTVPAAWDVLPTSFQDNDPIRRTCIGNTTGQPFKSGEEVCNTDGKLGVVLAIPASDFIPTTGTGVVQYPTNTCSGTYLEGNAPRILNCAPKGTTVHTGECPNADDLFAGDQCAVPVDTVNNTSQCLNPKSPAASISPRNLGAYDGRVHNLAMMDGDMNNGTISFIKETIQNGKTTPPNVDFFGGMGRIHSVQTIFDNTLNGGNPPNVGCQLIDATDQINCLAQADPCSIGYAGDGGKTWSERADAACTFLSTAAGGSLCTASGTGFTGATCPAACLAQGTLTAAFVDDSLRIDQIYPTAATVTALGQQSNEYQVGRKLYFNSIVGFNAIAATTGDPGAPGELALGEYETNPTNINPILTQVGYFPLGNQPTTGNDGAGTPNSVFNQPFCEDFNEQTVCNPTSSSPSTLPANVNACPGNANAPVEYGATGGIAAATPPPSQGSVCGNGTAGALLGNDPYEECDHGLNNGTAGDSCSVTCRCSGTTSFENKNDGTGWHCQ